MQLCARVWVVSTFCPVHRGYVVPRWVKGVCISLLARSTSVVLFSFFHSLSRSFVYFFLAILIIIIFFLDVYPFLFLCQHTYFAHLLTSALF